jgi:hypothetical protein
MRCTNRNIDERVSLSETEFDALLNIDVSKNHEISILKDLEKIESVGELISDAELIRIFHEQGHKEFMEEIRWNEKEAKSTRTGIDINTIDLTPLEKTGFHLLKNIEVVKAIKSFGYGRGKKLKGLTRKYFASSSGLVLFSSKSLKSTDFVEVGRLIQRFWLNATSKGLHVQPLTAPLFLGRAAISSPELFTEKELDVLTEIHAEIEGYFNLKNAVPMFLMRICKAEEPVRSLRREVADVLVYNPKSIMSKIR